MYKIHCTDGMDVTLDGMVFEGMEETNGTSIRLFQGQVLYWENGQKDKGIVYEVCPKEITVHGVIGRIITIEVQEKVKNGVSYRSKIRTICWGKIVFRVNSIRDIRVGNVSRSISKAIVENIRELIFRKDVKIKVSNIKNIPSDFRIVNKNGVFSNVLRINKRGEDVAVSV